MSHKQGKYPTLLACIHSAMAEISRFDINLKPSQKEINLEEVEIVIALDRPRDYPYRLQYDVLCMHVQFRLFF